ncbi:GTPase domain-containing protein [Rhodococcus erythropolis]|uniref:GTPase domain-containing protein n=1 Tax=Rhodococcus erythropolis TaxID=1833 RepID=UPI0008785602|nr:GTPase domain-containing protein [Rhodococcus erythropolis]MDF2468114.1 hypothetical protein [Rhodococcus erythropolis]OFV75125.1 hypothetical protein RERY_42910 [Rhodococcus erythropolis]
MNEIDILKVKEWLANLPGGSLADDYLKGWQQFASTELPVITVFGSYDTGKSSLIRRLLVDDDVPVPDWLTISARHETFGVNSVEFAGALLRDTPGLAVGADDVRGKLNTELAREAISTTDIAIVTVTPQLATGEYEFLRQIVENGWTPENLWFVISRFDEAGVDPDGDLDGYRQLAARKTSELVNSLKLSSAYPVHVVSQDFAQMAGGARDVEADTWDDSREWDGMDGFGAAIKNVTSGDVASLRASTEQRYWRHAVLLTVDELEDQLAACEPLLVQADIASARREQWKRSLDDVDHDARADLRGTLGQAVRLAVAGGEHNSANVAKDLQSALTDWFRKHERELDRLLQDVVRTDERQRQEPSWKNLEELTALAVDINEVPEVRIETLAPYVSKFGPLLIEGLREFERSQAGGSLKKSQARAVAAKAVDNVGTFGKGLALASELLPLAVEIVEAIDGLRAQQAVAVQERRALNSQTDKLAEEVSALALDSWAEILAKTRNEIDQTAAQAALSDTLHDSVEKLRAAIAEVVGILNL